MQSIIRRFADLRSWAMNMTELVEQTTAGVEHPSVAQERLHLGATLEAIAVAVERPLKADTGTGDEAALLAMEEYRAWRRVQLREALHSPYFARIDFIADDSSSGRPQTFYIGKTNSLMVLRQGCLTGLSHLVTR